MKIIPIYKGEKVSRCSERQWGCMEKAGWSKEKPEDKSTRQPKVASTLENAKSVK